MSTSRYSLEPFVQQLRNTPEYNSSSLDCFVEIQKFFENSSYSLRNFDIQNGNLRYANCSYQNGKTIDIPRTNMVFLPNSMIEHKLQNNLTLVWDLKNSQDYNLFTQCLRDKKIEAFYLRNIKFKTARDSYSKSIKSYIKHHQNLLVDTLIENGSIKGFYSKTLSNMSQPIDYLEEDQNYYLIYRIPIGVGFAPTAKSRQPDIKLDVLKDLIWQVSSEYANSQNKKSFRKSLERNYSLDHIERIQYFVQELSNVYDVECYEIEHATDLTSPGSPYDKIRIEHLCAKIKINPRVFVGDDSCYCSKSRAGETLISQIKKLLK